MRLCIDCRVDISTRSNRAVRCISCQKIHRKNVVKAKNNKYYRKNHPKKGIGSKKAKLGGLPINAKVEKYKDDPSYKSKEDIEREISIMNHADRLNLTEKKILKYNKKYEHIKLYNKNLEWAKDYRVECKGYTKGGSKKQYNSWRKLFRQMEKQK